MDFDIPVTKTQMFDVLSDIFMYYRIKRTYYEGVTLENLSLTRLELQMPTETELKERAGFNVYAELVKNELEYADEIKKSVEELQAKLIAVESAEKLAVSEVEEKYRAAIVSVNVAAVNGQEEKSDAYFVKVAEIEKTRAKEIADLNADYGREKKVLTEEIAALTEKLNETAKIFEDIKEQKIQSEYLELKEKAEDRANEIIKYNNNLEEKELKYRNAVKQAQASLELKFLSIRSENLSKDELVELGYYNDVLDCVCGFYDTLSPKTAYNDILNENRLMLYLEDYYQQIVYLYQTRALNG